MHGCGATMEIYRGHDAGAALSQLCLPAEKCCAMPSCEEFAVHSTQLAQGKQAKQASRLPRRTDCPSNCRTIPACDVCPDNLAVLCCRSLPASQQQTDTPWTETAQTNGLSEQMQDDPRMRCLPRQSSRYCAVAVYLHLCSKRTLLGHRPTL